MSGRVALVTGATSGMGLATAEALARMGAATVLVARDPAKGAGVVERLAAETGNPAVEVLVADLSSQEQIHRLAAEFRSRHDRLHVLVNNAGGYFSRRYETLDGLELTFALNHLGYFLLTELLLDSIMAAAPARIVNIASDAHRGAEIVWDDLQSTQGYGRFGFTAYGRSKLANVLFTYELARRLDGTGVTVNAVHPGFVASGFGRNNAGVVAFAIKWLGRGFGKTPKEGAETAVYLATSPAVEGVTGKYWADKRPRASSALSYDRAAARRLWEVSESLVEHPGATTDTVLSK